MLSPSKVLLFGEFAIVVDGQGLAMPFDQFCGKYEQGDSSIGEVFNFSQTSLKEFYSYLQKNQPNWDYPVSFDFDSMYSDLDNHIYYNSNIPMGYGLGSSGALIASATKRYSNIADSKLTISQLREFFVILESHYHGTSSGIDPLVCYLNNPILIKTRTNLVQVEIPKASDTSIKYNLYLLDTQKPRKTGPLVNWFVDQLKNPDYNQLCREVYCNFNQQAIDALLQNNAEQLRTAWNGISRYQRDNFQPMVPKFIHSAWDAGLESGEFAIKICGAGGGGFMLAICETDKPLKKFFNSNQIFKFSSI